MGAFFKPNERINFDLAFSLVTRKSMSVLSFDERPGWANQSNVLGERKCDSLTLVQNFR